MARAKKSKRAKVSWLGNLRTGHKEFHRIVEGEKHDPRCNLGEIGEKYRKQSRTAKALRELGLDAAAYCNVRFVSTR